jgi:hypothetical protein
MPGSGDRKPRSRVKRVALLTTSLVLMLASLALAAVGLVNPGFEDGLSGWNATIQKGVYGLEEPADCPARDANSRYGGIRGVCVVGTDTFTVRDHAYEVVPAEGQKMVRLGGPFQSRDELQPAWERYGVSQTFKVDPQNPVVKVNYNAWTFDYTGFDELRFTATLVNENNEELANFVQGAYGSGTRLKSTGWQTVYLDLTGFENQDVKLAVKSGGTWDSLYGFWSYIDAGVEHEKPVGNPTFSLPDGISGQQFSSGPSGQTWLTVPAAQVGSSCIPLTVRVPIDPGAATLSNVRLVMLEGNKSTLRPMVHEGNNVYSYEIPCIRTMELLVSYRLTEDGASEDFVVPIGGLVLVDPAGVIYDRATFEASKAGGASDEAARAAAAIKGATVRLQRKVNNTFINVLSGDPGIKPKINPQVTGPDGWFAWDTSAGTYRVVAAGGPRSPRGDEQDRRPAAHRPRRRRRPGRRRPVPGRRRQRPDRVPGRVRQQGQRAGHGQQPGHGLRQQPERREPRRRQPRHRRAGRAEDRAVQGPHRHQARRLSQGADADGRMPLPEGLQEGGLRQACQGRRQVRGQEGQGQEAVRCQGQEGR